MCVHVLAIPFARVSVNFHSQAGSEIVEALRKYRHPVFVYIPCGAELRCVFMCMCVCDLCAKQEIVCKL